MVPVSVCFPKRRYVQYLGFGPQKICGEVVSVNFALDMYFCDFVPDLPYKQPFYSVTWRPFVLAMICKGIFSSLLMSSSIFDIDCCGWTLYW